MDVSSRKTLTKSDILEGLQNLGLLRGMAVEVHSALGKMGYVECGAASVIEALVETVGEEGAIVMSAYRVTPPLPLTDEEKARGLVAKVRFLEEDSETKSGMGVISDTFRHWPGTVLGTGIHRVCAKGKDAHLHSRGYDHLLSIDGWALLIGVDITRCSSMHMAESKVNLPGELVNVFRAPEDILLDYPETDWYIEYADPQKPLPANPWYRVSDEAERTGLIRHGRIGEAECLFFKARAVVGIYEEMMRKDPFFLFGIKSKK